MTHLGPLLSALLDGQLSADEQAAVDEHLATCAECAAELRATVWAKQLVADLPGLEPPFGLIERTLMLPKKRSRTPVWIAGAAAAVVAGLLLVVPGQQSSVRPPVGTFVDAHVTAATTGDPLSGLAPAAVPVSFSTHP